MIILSIRKTVSIQMQVKADASKFRPLHLPFHSHVSCMFLMQDLTWYACNVINVLLLKDIGSDSLIKSSYVNPISTTV